MNAPTVLQAIDQVYRRDARRVFATLVRLLGDFDLAEEALHDAFRAALEQWPAWDARKPIGMAGIYRALQGH